MEEEVLKTVRNILTFKVSVASKRSVSSVIASPEVEKRPPVKDLNLTSRLVLNAVKQAVDDTKESKPIGWIE